ncbi:ssk1 response regulator receiver [Xylographa opegraphella]|nr:ssk1 response regulator receiver [Xylographa opegraphella]
MTDLKTRLLPLFRRSSASSAKSSVSSSASVTDAHRSRSKTSLLLTSKGRKGSVEPVYEEDTEQSALPPPLASASTYATGGQSIEPQELHNTSLDASQITPILRETPVVTLEEATPDPLRPLTAVDELDASQVPTAHDEVIYTTKHNRPDIGSRQQSLVHNNQKRFIKTLLEAERGHSRPESQDSFGRPATLSASMLHRKIWVRRPNASATLVVISEDDLVDDVREMILRKYANSLGRSFDAPDVTLRIVQRDHSHRHKNNNERTLGPEEPITRTLDAYYPGGQTVDEALIIDVPQRRTPRQSPRVHMPYYLTEDIRPIEGGSDYFPPMLPGASSPHHASNLSVHNNTGNGHAQHAMSILTTGQPPPLPSPGSRGTRHVQNRPKYVRNHTTSPTILSTVAGHGDPRASHPSAHPVPQNLPTPPIPATSQRSISPPPRISSPRPAKPSRQKKSGRTQPALPKGLLDGAVPPINVLIVEDNIINLKLLEAFMKRLKVRWHTAMNGREAVNKWRAGGFHLVLMDIQLPVMNGLEATKEIRRLERVNEIGVLAGSVSGRSSVNGKGSIDGDAIEKSNDVADGAADEDRLMNTELFKSPVIIVALTASSLQSDRHEALAAGCNDFLTKVCPLSPEALFSVHVTVLLVFASCRTDTFYNQPVNFVWLERKVMEWGCMQALIDFDGWRKWKDFSQTPAATAPPAPPQLLNNSSGSTVASINSIKESTKDSPKSSLRSGDRGTSYSAVVPSTPAVAVKSTRKAKRSSLNSGEGLTGVLEDSAEGESGKRGIMAGRA